MNKILRGVDIIKILETNMFVSTLMRNLLCYIVSALTNNSLGASLISVVIIFTSNQVVEGDLIIRKSRKISKLLCHKLD